MTPVPRIGLVLALALSGCCKSTDVDVPAATAACTSSGSIADSGGDAACSKCCKAQRATNGTVYGYGSCKCFDANTSFFAPAVTITTAVALESDTVPPRFKLSGPGDTLMFIVLGPFTSDELRQAYAHGSPGGAKVLWSLKAKDVTVHARSFPVVRYGVMPSDVVQLVGPPPSLVTGQLYVARVSAEELLIDGRYPALRDLCFEVRGAKVAEVPCK